MFPHEETLSPRLRHWTSMYTRHDTIADNYTVGRGTVIPIRRQLRLVLAKGIWPDPKLM